MSGRRAKSTKPALKEAPIKPAGMFSHSDLRLFAITLAVTVTAGIFHNSGGNPVIAFVTAGAGLATLASLVGRSVEALGDRLGAGGTGVLQSFLGNLPEFFVIMFSLKAGLYEVVKATLVGSILANVLLVMGLAFVAGGLKHGRQHFNAQASRQLALLLTLSVFALAIPTLTSALHSPAADHERAVTIVVSVLLLLLFAASLPDTLRSKAHEGTVTGSPEALEAKSEEEHHGQWPLQVAIGILALAGVGAALVSDWFVAALTPAIDVMHISEAFAGLIIVAIAGNAVENVVGIQLAFKNKSDYALQVILQSPVQVAMTIAPVIGLCAGLVGAGSFTLVLSPLLLAVLFMAAIVAVLVVIDGDSTWFEGATLIVLYLAIATAFWWG
jgi:Ca2+:H+ antiporter